MIQELLGLEGKAVFACCFLLVSATSLLSGAEQISGAFEMRFVSSDPKADGETDWKKDRVEYLGHYAETAKRFFDDPNLDTLTVTDKEVSSALKKLKPQPLPEVRERIVMRDWRWHGSKKGQHELSEKRVAAWDARPDLSVKNEALLVKARTAEVEIDLAGQSWRFYTEFRMRPSGKGRRMFEITGDGGKTLLTAGIDQSGASFYTTAGEKKSGPVCATNKWHTFKLEVDLTNPDHQELNDYVEPIDLCRYNLYVDGELVADYVPVDKPGIKKVEALKIVCLKGDALDDFHGVGYGLRSDWKKDYPFTIDTYLDETFSVKQEVVGWTDAEYDDSRWTQAELPIVHGGERYRGEHLYLRTIVKAGKFEQAVLNIETLDPSGEVYVNGERVKAIDNREPHRINLTGILKPGKTNLVAVRVDPFVVADKDVMHHLPTDRHIGWFSGRMSLDLRHNTFIDDVYACTESIGDSAKMKVRVSLKSDESGPGTMPLQVKARLTRWHPEESKDIAAEACALVSLGEDSENDVNLELEVSDPELWTFRTPNLYKLQVTLLRDGKAIDDAVVTTGIRTVSQEGGTFRINGQPETLRAPLVFGYRPPLDKVSAWDRCGPEEWLMRELLMIKNMNGNGARMSVHHGKRLSINDPRWVEMADQIGFMWLWGTTPWVREDGVGGDDHWAGLERYVRQVYNHPSIVIWQVSNHPSFPDWDGVMDFYKRIHGTIYPIDSSRLISPTADMRRVHQYGDYSDDGKTDFNGNPKEKPADPIWTAPMITRGSMDTPTGYGRDWSLLRKWPYVESWQGGMFMQTHLNSKERAYFNFEQEESIGQPNWNLRKGKPHYRVHSYEWKYDKGSIGTWLSCDQWEESQAWQAFSAYEAIRKMRWMDYDGFSWCCLHGGANTATYMKPLIDFYGYAKLAWHANKMVFQDVLAGSKNVDMVYGPGDAIPVTVLNLGDEKTVTVEVMAKKLDGTEIARMEFKDVSLSAGRTVADLGEWKPDLPENEYCVFEYRVFQQ